MRGCNPTSGTKMLVRDTTTEWTKVNMCTLLLPEIVYETNANPQSFYEKRPKKKNRSSLTFAKHRKCSKFAACVNS